MNGVNGHAIIVPQMNDKESFWGQAKKLKWIKSLLEHVSEKMT
jgi:hypothetical protein